MSSEANRELIRHIMEDGFNKQDMSVVYESFHENYVRHGHGVASMGSLAEHVQDLIARHKAFEDAKFTIRNIVADNKIVAVQYDFSGVHRSDFNGIPVSGKKSRAQQPPSSLFLMAKFRKEQYSPTALIFLNNCEIEFYTINLSLRYNLG